MTMLHRSLLLATVIGFLVLCVTMVVRAPGQPVIQIVVGGLSLALGLVGGLDVGGAATRLSDRHRRAVGGEQPLESVTGIRIGSLVIFGGLGLAELLLGVLAA
ncbi:hypothetical protein [Cryptosporangium phraense]|uniref:Uncharacterized protein n=1 Tax=Cryptosporangium phraense TaxID=2593070 RepID=A0A545AKX3_9ACTN|nr:hypothetical protein [Cryptosporangium phraense]TQS41385.1 hypothetical protein FL583_30250 [Cryptosporangium phraense]